MDIREVKLERDKMAKEIAAMLDGFVEKYDVNIGDIQFSASRDDFIDGYLPPYLRIEVLI